MNGIAALFLRAKHWQIFLLLFGVMLVGDMAMMSPTAMTAQPGAQLWKISPLFAVMMVLCMGSFLGWLWSMGTFLNSIVQPSLRLATGFFRVALFFPAIYFSLFIASFPGFKPSAFVIIIPLHLFAMFCMLYLLYFVSKSLVLADTGKSASFYDYAGPFFLIWLFPVGVWIIQPRINRLYVERQNAEPPNEASAG
jgi:hypothetical protein